MMATVFKLCWRLVSDAPDRIYNVLHAVTMGRADNTSKTHLEQLAQILYGDLHITCRIIDSFGVAHRHTMALPGSWQHYQDRAMLLIYTGDVIQNDPAVVQTTSMLYDLANKHLLQQLTHSVVLRSSQDLDFASWPQHRVICDHEQNHVPRDHVMVHGHGDLQQHSSTSFELISIWSSLGHALDPANPFWLEALMHSPVPDRIGSAEAWYNCHCDRVVMQGTNHWTLCTGRYRQTDRLGIWLPTRGSKQDLV